VAHFSLAAIFKTPHHGHPSTVYPRTWHGFLPDLGPADCPQCHTFLAPGNFQRSWMPCNCPPAQESGQNGHDVWRCLTCEGEKISAVCYSPPHCPVGGQDQLTGR
jgi:hypothetical protein